MKISVLKSVFVLVLASALGCSDDPTPGPNPTNNNNIEPDMTSDIGGTNNEDDMGENNTPDMETDQDPDLDPDMGEDMDPDLGPGCEDECQPGEQVCDGTGAFQICGQFDDDECVEFSQSIACTQGHSCLEDRCVPPCRDECPSGTTVCLDENTVGTCGNYDADSCREAGAGVACGANERCEQGACVDTTEACTDECSTGESVCFGDATRVCGQFDSDSCLDLGPAEPCASGELCANGTCAVPCSDTCSTEGAEECSGNGVRTCERTAQGCLAWSPVVACSASETCSNGVCAANCSDECPTSGAAICSPDNSGVSICGQFDGDACLDRSSPVPCQAGFACDQGQCVATCSDECTQGATQCSGNSLETCGNYDADPCLEWGGAVACPGGATCSNDTCDLPCSDECTTSGAVECSGNGTRSCGQFDLDNCLEWSTTTACQSYEVCAAGACELGATPAIVLINELVYDSMGTDSAAGNTLFVELSGPPGQSLDGYSVVGVNGSGGGDYNAIPLTGETIGQDGFFVIAHPNGDATLVASAEMTSTAVDFQNGPDSVQVRWRGRVVDALGYGSFGANDTFAGEGTAAGSAQNGASLSRDLDSNDTDDNSVDFTVQASPTPGAAAISCMNDCSMGQTRCDGTQIQSCGNFDADTCLEWGPSMACSGSQTCQGTTCQDPCTDECSAQGATQCSGEQVRTCGNYDTDSCLEWSTAADCPGTQVCTLNVCQDATAPEVVLISPQGTLQTTQGNVHRMLVDATPNAGRTISQVRYYANGALLGSTTSTPHEYFYTVPANHPTNTQIVLQAQATDNTGIVGSSAFAYLDVRNDAPVASFTATITNTTTVTVDASGSTDTETATPDLEVCWDWNNDGTCDTPFSTQQIRSHDFGASGNYTIRMVVRDAVGQTTSTTRQVSFADIQYVGGSDVTTTLWYGTIIVTGNVTVPSGNTLTIAPGTDILFVYSDVAAPTGVGDYRITVNGNMVVNGTAADPVVFSGQDQTAKVPGGWDRIILNGAGSVIDHAIIEYADFGLDIRSDAQITNTEVRNTRDNCIDMSNADNASLEDVVTRECGGNGVEVRNGSNPVDITSLSSTQNGESGIYLRQSSVVTMTTSTLAGNADEGAYVDTSTLNLSDSVVENNLNRGLIFNGDSGGTVTRNQIRTNAAAGIELLASTTQAASPSPVVNLNNIYSNSTSSTVIYEGVTTSSILTASYSSCCSSAGVSSSDWTKPVGSTIRRVRLNYNETDYSSNYVIGYLINAETGSTIQQFNSDFNGWIDIPSGVNSLRVRVRDSGYGSTTDTITVSQVEVERTGQADVSASLNSAIDFQRNYLGTWPNVMTRTFESSRNMLNVQGFVGVPFTSSWDTGVYMAGDVSGSWSSTVYITGNTTIPAGQVLNVDPSTQILFVNHDQNLDNVGDFEIKANGQFNLNGAQGNEVLIAGLGASDIDMFQEVNLDGSAADQSTWNDVNLRNGQTGVMIRGTSSLTRVNISTVGRDGIYVISGAPSLSYITVDGAVRYGVHVGAASPALSRMLIRNGLSHGLFYNGANGGTLEDSTIRENQGDGVHVNGPAAPSVNYNLITYNGATGIRVNGNSAMEANNNVIKFNDDAGVALRSTVSSHPTAKFNYSNIYGNAVLGTTIAQAFTTSSVLTASYSSCCSSTGVTSSDYTLPNGRQARLARIAYNETDYSSNYVIGYLINATTGATIQQFNADFNGWVELPSGVTSLRVRVRDSGYGSTTDTITVHEVLSDEYATATAYELAAMTVSGTSDAKFNYWTPTIGEVPTKIHQARNGSVDFTGFTGAEYPSGQVTQVGPRP